MTEPRQYTADEIRDQWLKHIWNCIDYWSKVDRFEPGEDPTRERLSGLAHSILTSIDGLSGGMPCGFRMFPTCHPTDPEYLKSLGNNWCPTNEKLDGEAEVTNTILNDIFFRYDPKSEV